MTARLPYLTAEKLENHRHVRTHDVTAAEAAVMHGSGKTQIAARSLHRHRQMAQAPVNVGCGIIEAGTRTAVANATRSLTLHLENADFALAASDHRIIARFNFGDLQGKPCWHARARCLSFNERNHIVACRLANLREMSTAMMFGVVVFKVMVVFENMGFSAASHSRNADRSRGQQKCKLDTHVYIPFVVSEKNSNNQASKAFGTFPLDRRCRGEADKLAKCGSNKMLAKINVNQILTVLSSQICKLNSYIPETFHLNHL